ncbi:MAG TPA: hypothetical protein VEF04_08365, partial [Blastocatellia bacterium]|nr:hypothetical protein [Blastocatellia bacterium]
DSTRESANGHRHSAVTNGVHLNGNSRSQTIAIKSPHPGDEDAHHNGINGLNGSNGTKSRMEGASALSPRERLASPHRKSPAVQPLLTTYSAARRVRRLELDDDQTASTPARQSPTDSGGDFSERLARLETRLDTEFADITERFARLEKTLNDLTRLIVQGHAKQTRKDGEVN